jgi:hypothetical protein
MGVSMEVCPSIVIKPPVRLNEFWGEYPITEYLPAGFAAFLESIQKKLRSDDSSQTAVSKVTFSRRIGGWVG